MPPLETSVKTNPKLIPILDVEDQLNFQDYLMEVDANWLSLSPSEAIEHVSRYLAEESNANYIIEENPNGDTTMVCNRIDEIIHLEMSCLATLSNQITKILSQLAAV